MSRTTLTRYLTILVLVSVVSLEQVAAYRLMPKEQLMYRKAQAYVENRVEQDGPEYLDSIYHKVVISARDHYHPVVRFVMGDLKERLERNFAASKLARRQDLPKSGALDDLGLGQPAEKYDVRPSYAGSSYEPSVSNSSADSDDDTELVAEETTDVAAGESSASLPTKTATSKHADMVRPVAISLPAQQNRYVLGQGRIDVTVLQKTWLDRVNQARRERGLHRYQLDTLLHRTSTEWSQQMKKKGVADHKRYTNSSYYDYEQLENRFAARGVRFANVQRSTFTENVGYARFACDEVDCTDEAIEAMRRVFDYFMSEEGKAYDVHYRTIVHPRYEVMGFGLAVDEVDNWLYVTQHYGTEVVRDENIRVSSK